MTSRLGLTRWTVRPASSISSTALLDMPSFSLAPTTARVAGDRRRARLTLGGMAFLTLLSDGDRRRRRQRGTHMSTNPTLRIEVTGAVTIITLDCPERRNMIDLDTCVALREQFAAVDADKLVRAVVIAGTGRDFCTGADVTARS